MPGLKENGEAALATSLAAVVTGGVIVRTNHGERPLESTEYPVPGTVRVEVVCGDGSGLRDEKGSQRHIFDVEVVVRFWIADESNTTRGTTFNAALREVLTAIQETSTGNPRGSSGFWLEWDRWQMLRDARDVPPYAGARIPIRLKFRE